MVAPVHVPSSKDRPVTQILPAMLAGRAVQLVPQLRVTEYLIEGLLPRNDVAEKDSLTTVTVSAVVVVGAFVVVGAAVVVGAVDVVVVNAMPTVTSPVCTNDPIPK